MVLASNGVPKPPHQDHTPLPGPPAQCTLFGGCYQAGLALALNATIQAAVTTQNTRCTATSASSIL